MFNRLNFNRGKFNIADSTTELSGMAGMHLNGTVTASLAIEAPNITAVLSMSSYGNAARRITPNQSEAEIKMDAVGRNIRRLFGVSDTIGLQLGASGVSLRFINAPNTDADINIEVLGTGIRLLFGNAPQARVELGLKAQGTRAIHASSTLINIICDANGVSRRLLFANAPDSELELGLSGMADMYGFAIIDLGDLTIPVGGDLIIDTGSMTVTLNGQDVTRFVGRNSEFFKLRPGDNLILYEDGVVNRNISYNILWKDLWL